MDIQNHAVDTDTDNEVSSWCKWPPTCFVYSDHQKIAVESSQGSEGMITPLRTGPHPSIPETML